MPEARKSKEHVTRHTLSFPSYYTPQPVLYVPGIEVNLGVRFL
jgi:hypothetical protein